jgi:hypothetical protein
MQKLAAVRTTNTSNDIDAAIKELIGGLSPGRETYNQGSVQAEMNLNELVQNFLIQQKQNQMSPNIRLNSMSRRTTSIVNDFFPATPIP